MFSDWTHFPSARVLLSCSIFTAHLGGIWCLCLFYIQGNKFTQVLMCSNSANPLGRTCSQDHCTVSYRSSLALVTHLHTTRPPSLCSYVLFFLPEHRPPTLTFNFLLEGSAPVFSYTRCLLELNVNVLMSVCASLDPESLNGRFCISFIFMFMLHHVWREAGVPGVCDEGRKREAWTPHSSGKDFQCMGQQTADGSHPSHSRLR